MRKVRYFILIALTAVVVGCNTIFEFPDQDAADPTLVEVDLTLDISADIQAFTPYGSTEGRATTYSVRTIVEVYQTDNYYNITGEPVGRNVIYNSAFVRGEDFNIETSYKLHARRYKMLIWTDITQGQSNSDYYITDNLQTIDVKMPYAGSTDLKDGFCASADIDLIPYAKQWAVNIKVPVSLQRPFAKIEVIATDLEQYYNKLASRGQSRSENMTVRFAYTGGLGFFPTRFNVATNKPTNALQGIWFNSSLTPVSNTEALVAYDYVFVNGTESGVSVDMMFYDNGTLINTVEGIAVPIKRGKLTTIRGDFLTRDYTPGIKVDPDYEGEFSFEIKDN